MLQWCNLKFDLAERGGDDNMIIPNVYYECEHCGAELTESDKFWMLKNGEWRKKTFNGVAGFHISELYSPWVKWSEMVESFLKAKVRNFTDVGKYIFGRNVEARDGRSGHDSLMRGRGTG